MSSTQWIHTVHARNPTRSLEQPGSQPLDPKSRQHVGTFSQQPHMLNPLLLPSAASQNKQPIITIPTPHHQHITQQSTSYTRGVRAALVLRRAGVEAASVGGSAAAAALARRRAVPADAAGAPAAGADWRREPLRSAAGAGSASAATLPAAASWGSAGTSSSSGSRARPERQHARQQQSHNRTGVRHGLFMYVEQTHRVRW